MYSGRSSLVNYSYKSREIKFRFHSLINFKTRLAVYLNRSTISYSFGWFVFYIAAEPSPVKSINRRIKHRGVGRKIKLVALRSGSSEEKSNVNRTNPACNSRHAILRIASHPDTVMFKRVIRTRVAFTRRWFLDR